MRARFGLITAAAVAMALSSPAIAAADEVFISGSTAGCFGTGCVPGANATFLGLTYSNSTFAGTTAAGFRGVGNSPNPGSNVNNLGSFTLSTAPNNYNGQTFTLRVTFTAPQGINGSNQATFTATLTGSVISDNIGGVLLNFNNTPILFTFNDPTCEPDPTGGIPGQQTTCGAGSFQFSVNDVALDPGQTAALTGQFTSASQSASTPVTLHSAAATRTSRGVLVRWRTASEIGTLGFHVYREVNGKRVRVSKRLIAAKGGGAYSFLDRRAPRRAALRYWIQEVAADGSRSWYGPARVVRRT
jgi:hypothetical protein